MTYPAETVVAPRRLSFAANFCVVLGAFSLLTLLSWPILLSFDLWVFKDRSSFLNLDYLAFTRHYRIGVDICYSYGLLPVLLQHVAFGLTGPGYKPMIGCTLLVLLLTSVFFACLLRHLPAGNRWLFAVIALSPTILIINPNWPYSLAVLSILFALLFVLKNRLEIALAVSSVGCFCVPSLPLVLTGLLAICILFNWWRHPGRTILQLAARFAPGAVVYLALASLLGSVFGFSSLAATALPIAGARYYKAVGYGTTGAFLDFLHPDGYSAKYYFAYYLGSPVTWFVFCTLLLFGLSVSVLVSLVRERRIEPAGILVVVYSLMHTSFMLFAYAGRGQHVLYDCVLAAVALVGISLLPRGKMREAFLVSFVFIGLLGESGAAYKTLLAWQTTAPGANTLGLYAGTGLARDWSDVVSISRQRKTLLLGYATGQHIYYPTLEDPDAWFMVRGLVFPNQEEAIINQIKQAEVVVIDGTSPSPIISDKVEAEIAAMREIHPGGAYHIFVH